MKKSVIFFIFITSIIANSLSLGATLNSMNKQQIEQAFVNKTITVTSIAELNKGTIETFKIFLDDKNHIAGKLVSSSANDAETDKGVYRIENDGTLYITWQYWDNAKELCLHIYDTQNAYISIDCNNGFHTFFMKGTIQTRNDLK